MVNNVHFTIGYFVAVTSDNDKNNIVFEYHAGSDFTLTCMVTPTPPSDSEFRWSCSTGCVVDGKIGQTINITELRLTDSGDVNCSVFVDGFEYTSKPIELRVIGKLQ